MDPLALQAASSLLDSGSDCRQHPYLSCQTRDIHGIQIRWSAWEASIVAEEHQPRGESESVFSTFGHHDGVIAGRQQLKGCFTPALIAHDAITSVFATVAKRRESGPQTA